MADDQPLREKKSAVNTEKNLMPLVKIRGVRHDYVMLPDLFYIYGEMIQDKYQHESQSTKSINIKPMCGLTLTYGPEIWILCKKLKSKINAAELWF